MYIYKFVPILNPLATISFLSPLQKKQSLFRFFNVLNLLLIQYHPTLMQSIGHVKKLLL